MLGRALPSAASERLGLFVSESALEVRSFGFEHFEIARGAYRRFGKRSGHRAHLNFGDCMTYAIARVAGVPLLFKGDDFTKTDLERVSTT